ncbi:MAG: serine hydrolase, partial [Verrucomicrobiota bacterium]
MLNPETKQKIQARFESNFDTFDELGAAVSVWCDGTEVLSLVGGHTTREKLTYWTEDTLVPVWSATKG